jgi:hypothetical protein
MEMKTTIEPRVTRKTKRRWAMKDQLWSDDHRREIVNTILPHLDGVFVADRAAIRRSLLELTDGELGVLAGVSWILRNAKTDETMPEREIWQCRIQASLATATSQYVNGES